jgi:CRP/FNR family transcriptional regulator, cyclic AMP receptor protein
MESDLLTPLVGHLAYVLLVAMSLVRAILPLRLLAVGAGLASVWYGLRIGNGVEILWESIFTAVNFGQAIILIRERQGIRLSKEEQALHASLFSAMSVVDFHRFVRAGTWESQPAGFQLTTRGAPVRRVALLSEGTAEVIVDGKTVALCKPGDFVGELAFMSGGFATATVVTSSSVRFLTWDFEDLQALLGRHAEIRTALQNVLNKNLMDKLMEQRDRTRASDVA